MVTKENWASYTKRLKIIKLFRSQQTHAEMSVVLTNEIGWKYQTCLISSDWIESKSDAKTPESVTVIHYVIFCVICQLYSADRLWLSSTSVNLFRLYNRGGNQGKNHVVYSMLPDKVSFMSRALLCLHPLPRKPLYFWRSKSTPCWQRMNMRFNNPVCSICSDQCENTPT